MYLRGNCRKERLILASAVLSKRENQKHNAWLDAMAGPESKQKGCWYPDSGARLKKSKKAARIHVEKPNA